jgi:hypothetical protein
LESAVDIDDVPGAFGRNGEVVLNHERLGDVAIEPEPVRFEIGALNLNGVRLDFPLNHEIIRV